MHLFPFIVTTFFTVITCDQLYASVPEENGFSGIWLHEKRSGDYDEAVRSVRSPLGTMRFGKRGVTPLGTMRFGKRSDPEHFFVALALVEPGSDTSNSGDGGTNDYLSIYDKPSYLVPYGKRNRPLGTMRFG